MLSVAVFFFLRRFLVLNRFISIDLRADDATDPAEALEAAFAVLEEASAFLGACRGEWLMHVRVNHDRRYSLHDPLRN